ncbi:MAG TPA: hypothetical protein VK603_10335, partial [Candidatus Saccharimonadales bacterium]|nr:hypothetical protein [Candidatus Saccharimonadales bacterium]
VQKLERYYLGVDWADEFHQVRVSDPEGNKVIEKKVVENVEGLTEFGRFLDESRAKGIELWAAIEKPHGRIVDKKCARRHKKIKKTLDIPHRKSPPQTRGRKQVGDVDHRYGARA